MTTNRKPAPERVELRIDSIAAGGAGVSRYNGKVVFTPLTAPGDVALVDLSADKGNFYQGSLVELADRSEQRAEPECEYYGECGGCNLMHLSYAAQLEAKAGILRDTLVRIGRFDDPPIGEVHPSPREYGYRGRIRLHRRGSLIGFFERAGRRIVPVRACPVAGAGINTALGARAELLRKAGSAAQLEVREVPGGWEASPTKHSGQEQFAQANTELNEQLVARVTDVVRASVEPGANLLELFCGDGNFTVGLLASGLTATAVDNDGAALKSLRERADAAGFGAFLTEITADLAAPAEKLRPRIADKQFGACLLDPPRVGAKTMVPLVGELAPATVVYVSCDPGTLARDLRTLHEEFGYQLESVEGFDMFPQTSHLEVLAVMRRKDFTDD